MHRRIFLIPSLVFAIFFTGIVELYPQDQNASTLQWEVILASRWAEYDGDELLNWDRARDGVHDLVHSWGIEPTHVQVMSSLTSRFGQKYLESRVLPVSDKGIKAALGKVDSSPGHALLLFITSHGAPRNGVVFQDGRALSVAELREYLAITIGDMPAVIILSACFSGQFLGDDGIGGPNRVVLTAARADRSSFGCGPGTAMPEWDDSFLTVLNQAKASGEVLTWETLGTRVQAEISTKERRMPSNQRSNPQIFIGDAMRTSPAFLVPQVQEGPGGAL